MPTNSPTTYTGQKLTGLLTNTAAVRIKYRLEKKLYGQIVIEPTIYPAALDVEGKPVVFIDYPYIPQDIKGKPEPLYRPINRPYQPLADQGGEWWLATYRSGHLTRQDRTPPAGSILHEDKLYQTSAHEVMDGLYDMAKYDLLANGGLLVIPAVNPYLRGGKHANALMPLFEDGTLPDGLPEYKHTGAPVQLLTGSTRISQTDLKKR